MCGVVSECVGLLFLWRLVVFYARSPQVLLCCAVLVVLCSKCSVALECVVLFCAIFFVFLRIVAAG